MLVTALTLVIQEEREIQPHGNQYKVMIQEHDNPDNNYKFLVNYFSDILVTDGQEVEIFDQIIKGNINLFTYNQIYGPDVAKRYLVNLISSIFLNSGIYFDSKHLEILANAMFSYVEVCDNQGDKQYQNRKSYPLQEILSINTNRQENDLAPIIYEPTVKSINVLAYRH